MRTVIFLGAGFSRAWNLPVMSEFFNFAADSSRITDEDKKFLTELRRRARLGSSILDMRGDNLEDTLSFCLMAKLLDRTQQTGALSTFDRLCVILQRIYSTFAVTNFRFKTPLAQGAFKLLGPAGEERVSSTTVITTNYDVVAESMMMLGGCPARLPVKATSRTEPDYMVSHHLYSDRSDAPLICKLHGSLNWFIRPDNELVVEDRCVPMDFSTGQGSMVATSFDRYNNPDGVAPFIVPPTLFKWENNPVIRNTWDQASEAMRNAEILRFVGYSFPESDTYMRYFLAAGLYDNVGLREISVVDPNATAICDRLRARDYGNSFKQLLRAYAQPWQSMWQ